MQCNATVMYCVCLKPFSEFGNTKQNVLVFVVYRASRNKTFLRKNTVGDKAKEIWLKYDSLPILFHFEKRSYSVRSKFGKK